MVEPDHDAAAAHIADVMHDPEPPLASGAVVIGQLNLGMFLLDEPAAERGARDEAEIQAKAKEILQDLLGLPSSGCDRQSSGSGGSHPDGGRGRSHRTWSRDRRSSRRLGRCRRQAPLELVALREQRGLDNINRIVESVTESTGLSPDELATWARDMDGRLMLTTNVIQTAYNTLYEEKVTALTMILVENVRDDARLDISTVIVVTLADLEATHVRVLHAFEREDLPRRVDDLNIHPAPRFSLSLRRISQT